MTAIASTAPLPGDYLNEADYRAALVAAAYGDTPPPLPAGLLDLEHHIAGDPCAQLEPWHRGRLNP